MHNELFRRHGVDAVYVALDVPPARADGVADAVRTLALAGCNLTVPFKERIVAGLDGLDPEARLAGAVNVVLRMPDGALVGHNTDGEGYVRALEQEMHVRPAGRNVAVLGAGGTGRAVAAALARHGAGSITLYNRTVPRAEAAAAALSVAFPTARFGVASLNAVCWSERASGHDLVVNCTAGDGASAVEGLDVSPLPLHTVWTDANYWMADPPRFAACARRSLRIQRGIGMLMQQGALSYQLFTGISVDADAIRGVLDIGGW